MSRAVIEFKLSSPSIKVDIIFNESIDLESFLKIAVEKIHSLSHKNQIEIDTHKTQDFFSSFIITVNGHIVDRNKKLRDRDRVIVFHLIAGG
jgi:sulfur carrier protein ThiS